MKKILLILLFIGSALTSSASYAVETTVPPTCSDDSKPTGGGGVVVLPWSVARPFPWSSIQGMWSSTTDGNLKLIFVLKVVRSTASKKQLYVEIYDADNCQKASMRGVGLISGFDKNVLKANINNVLLKMALFKTSDLEISGSSCKATTLGATFTKFSNDEEARFAKVSSTNVSNSRTVLLKRISNSTAFKCTKN